MILCLEAPISRGASNLALSRCLGSRLVMSRGKLHGGRSMSTPIVFFIAVVLLANLPHASASIRPTSALLRRLGMLTAREPLAKCNVRPKLGLAMRSCMTVAS